MRIKKLAFLRLTSIGSFVHYLFGGFQFNFSKVFFIEAFGDVTSFGSVAFEKFCGHFTLSLNSFLNYGSDIGNLWARKKANPDCKPQEFLRSFFSMERSVWPIVFPHYQTHQSTMKVFNPCFCITSPLLFSLMLALFFCPIYRYRVSIIFGKE